MQVIEPKHFNTKSQGFMIVFLTKSVECKGTVVDKARTDCSQNKETKVFTL